jgi:hypothetical protein
MVVNMLHDLKSGTTECRMPENDTAPDAIRAFVVWSGLFQGDLSPHLYTGQRWRRVGHLESGSARAGLRREESVSAPALRPRIDRPGLA